ncbi:MAG: hypothetical protein IJ538_01590 [Clostridia bacterium]|nr:hypothetical protein [Clostridia bacterium]
MKEKNNIENVVSESIEKLKQILDVDVIIGDSIKAGETTIFPISKITFALVSGGGEYGGKEHKNNLPFSAGVGTGVNLEPIGFLVLNETGASILKIDSSSAIKKLVDAIPEVAKYVSKIFTKNDKTE